MQPSSAAAVAGSAAPRREPQREHDADEALLGAVVEVALDPPASVIGGFDDPGARLLELDPRVDVGDRLRDQLGERAEARLRIGGEQVGRPARRERTPQLAVHEDRRGGGRADAALSQFPGKRPDMPS